MSVKIPEETQRKLASVLNHVEETSELIRCVVVTRSGIKVAPDMDADTYSASSAALIDLGERVVSSLNHGGLQELLINALGGYVILVAIGKEYMLLGATSAALKMGYYLPFMKKTAWTLEHIIYRDETTVIEELEKAHAEMEADAGPSKGEVQKQEINHDEIREADMAAMDDVLAAFDDFGINDDFTKGLGSAPVPSVGISKDEMVEISKKLQVEQEAVPDFSTTTPSPTKTSDVTPTSSQAEAGAAIQDECPIPLEPGEVPPIPLSDEQLNPFGATEGVEESRQEDTTPAPAPAPAADATPATSAPVSSTTPVEAGTPPTVVSEEVKPPAPSQAEAEEPAKESAGIPPFFQEADEYNFDFDMDKDAGKDVVIQEQDSMSDALKALGWEEEDDT